ncbi:hypothetical protein CSQ90_05550 [Janthinobacterium sp. BJB303]|nr:hypothetical protein CSQ90_05550 [Janthinobacterium sp. BJB303]
MLFTVLPDTAPLRVLAAVAVEVLKAFATLLLLVPPLFAADEPNAVAFAPPLLLFCPVLLSLFWSELLSCVAVECAFAPGPAPDCVVALLAVWVLTPVTLSTLVMPLFWAWALKPKASATAAAMRVFFIAVSSLKVNQDAGTRLKRRVHSFTANLVPAIKNLAKPLN